MKYSALVANLIKSIPENKIIVASALYSASFSEIPELSFYKTLQRLCESGDLIRLTRGLYVRPRWTKYGLVSISDDEIVQHYVGNGKGVKVGYDLYNEHELTEQTAGTRVVFSNAITESQKTVGNVRIKKLSFKLTDKRAATIEVLEVLQCHQSIEDVNHEALLRMIESYAKEYSEKEAEFVIENTKYKKSTIASLEKALNDLSVENDLKKYLSPLSKYKTIDLKQRL